MGFEVLSRAECRDRREYEKKSDENSGSENALLKGFVHRMNVLDI